MKKYSFVFWCGYVSNEDGKPSIQHVTEKDISEDNGFFDEDIKEIKDLSVGQKHDIHGVLAVSYTHLTLPTIYSV